MKRFFREVEAIWRRTLHRRSQKAGMFMPRFLRLLRRFSLPKPTILNPYRSVIQELTRACCEIDFFSVGGAIFLEGKRFFDFFIAR